MRTTFDIADDVLAAARERARREQKSIGQVLSELARQALTAPSSSASAQPSEVREVPAVFGIQPFTRRGAIVTNELIEQLRQHDAF